MFRPGHLHLDNHYATADVPHYQLNVHYEVKNDTGEGTLLHFQVDGQINDHTFSESFDMHRDTAFNFALVLSRLAQKHGLPTTHNLLMRQHDDFDAMFEDIRHKLKVQPGDQVNLEHCQQDGC